MDYAAAVEEIKIGRIRPLYLIYGEEGYLARQIEKQIIDAVLQPDEQEMNLTVLDREPPAPELRNLVETAPFMGEKNVVIIRGTGLFRSRKGGGEETAPADSADLQWIEIFSNIPEYSCLVLSTREKADKRRTIFKTVEKNGAVVPVAPLKVNEIRPWLNEQLTQLDKRMKPNAMEYFMSIIGIMSPISLEFLANELEKMALYTRERREIMLRDIQAVLSSIPEISIFTMIDSLSRKQVSQALQLLDEQLAAGEPPLKILSLLARQVRMLWQAKEMSANGRGSREIAVRLGVPPFIGEKMVRQSRQFSLQSLKQASLALADADLGLKTSRTDSVVLEKIIIELCQ
ncbi:MAG: DNA polymerase III subunit delta [Veillonellales bacterium]